MIGHMPSLAEASRHAADLARRSFASSAISLVENSRLDAPSNCRDLADWTLIAFVAHTSALPIPMQSSSALTLRPHRVMMEEVYFLRRGIHATSPALYWCSMFSFSLY